MIPHILRRFFKYIVFHVEQYLLEQNLVLYTFAPKLWGILSDIKM